MKKLCTVFLVLNVFCLTGRADEKQSTNSFAVRCAELDRCIKAVSEITGDKYVFDTEVTGKVAASANVELTKENATLLLTKALDYNGYTRVPLDETNTYQVLRVRDARDTLLPSVIGDPDHAPNLPKVFDLYNLRYNTKHPENLDTMTRTLRSFMPASSRIVSVSISGQILVTASAPDIKNAYELLRDMDQKAPTKSIIESWKKDEEAPKASRLKKRTAAKELPEEPKAAEPKAEGAEQPKGDTKDDPGNG